MKDNKKINDNFSIKALKVIINEIIEIITTIFNYSLEHYIVPNILKEDKIILIYKNGEVKEPTNYRPITITSVVCKLLEKIVNNRLMEFINVNKIIINYHYGFRKNHSTSNTLLEITNKIYNTWNDRSMAIAVFIDLSKAFEILMLKSS